MYGTTYRANSRWVLSTVKELGCRTGQVVGDDTYIVERTEGEILIDHDRDGGGPLRHGML